MGGVKNRRGVLRVGPRVVESPRFAWRRGQEYWLARCMRPGTGYKRRLGDGPANLGGSWRGGGGRKSAGWVFL